MREVVLLASAVGGLALAFLILLPILILALREITAAVKDLNDMAVHVFVPAIRQLTSAIRDRK